MVTNGGFLVTGSSDSARRADVHGKRKESIM